MVYVLLLYALFASVFTVAKIGLSHAEPLFFMGTRMGVAGLLLLGYEAWYRGVSFSFDRKTWSRLFLLALFNIYLTNAFEFWALRHLTSFKTCFIYSLSPFLSALFSYLFFSETLSLNRGLGLLVGMIGIVPVLLVQGGEEGSAFSFSWPELAMLLAVSCSVYGWILLKQLVNEHPVSPLTANGCSMLVGGSLALIHSWMTEQWDPVPVTHFELFFWCTIGLILISNLICYNLYGALLKRHSATFLSIAGLTTPLFAALFGWVWLGEEITWPFYLSFAIVCIGLFLFDQEAILAAYRRRSENSAAARSVPSSSPLLE